MALVVGNQNPIEIARLIKRQYGGSNFQVHIVDDDGFYQIGLDEKLTPEQEAMGGLARRQQKIRPRIRIIGFFTDGSCACDYADITSDSMTIISMGNSGDCKEIIDPIVRILGGYIKDEAVSDDWVRLP
jgi:hypothetical protein